MIIRQLQLLGIAVAFLTRIPVPPSLPFSNELLNRANRYFGVAGLLVGVIAALSYSVASQFWADDIAIALSMAVTLLITGVFHEDGLADSADGLGGGLDVQAKLTIMKDSRIGSYGAAALMMTLLLKFTALNQTAWVVCALLVGHSLSRVIAASMIGALPYVRSEDGKSKPLASWQTVNDRIVLVLTSLLVLAFLPLQFALVLVVTLFAVRQFMKIWLMRQLGGFTGDTLGACQQISEIVIYLLFSLPVSQRWLEHSYG